MPHAPQMTSLVYNINSNDYTDKLVIGIYA